jgi:hypothetical protein
LEFAEKPRLRALLDHFAIIEDPREPWREAHPLAEVPQLSWQSIRGFRDEGHRNR